MACDRTWRKSSYSANQGECVEVATGQPGAVAVRDSKDPRGAAVTLAPAGWREFVADVKAGRRDLA